MMIDLVEPEQTGAAASPASAVIAPAPPAAVPVGTHSSSPSSEAMCGLNHDPRNRAVVHQDAQDENVYADEDGMRALIDDMDANVNNELRLRGVNDLNEMHAINGIGTNDDFLNMENGRSDSLDGVPISNANVCVSAASAPGVRVSRNNLHTRGGQYVNERERVIVTQAVVQAAPRQTGPPVNRSISPFDPKVVASRVSAPATMSAVTCCTSTTSTARPFATRTRDDFLRMSTTAHSRLVIRDPNAAQPTYVTWHGPDGQVFGTTEAPCVSLAPSYSMPAAIRVSSQLAHQPPIDVSTPLQAPPRRHEEEQLNSSSESSPSRHRRARLFTRLYRKAPYIEKAARGQQCACT